MNFIAGKERGCYKILAIKRGTVFDGVKKCWAVAEKVSRLPIPSL